MDNKKNQNTAAVTKSREEDITAVVASRIQTLMAAGELSLPKDYSPENALKSAYLILLETVDRDDRPVLEVCTRASVINALLDMILWGLSPAKKQVAFIARGNKLCCDKQYQGNIALAKRQAGLVEYPAQVVYKGDEVEFEINGGKLSVTKHVRSASNIDTNEITGAYCVLYFEGDKTHTEYMTINQIRKAWEMGAMKGNSPAHKNFPDQMCIRTVINRGVKLFIQTSDDSDLYDDNEETPYKAHKSVPEINGNTQAIGFLDPAKKLPEQIEPIVVNSSEKEPAVNKTGQQISNQSRGSATLNTALDDDEPTIFDEALKGGPGF